MEHSAYRPTPEEMILVQELAPGWETVWAEIATELLGKDGKGRLAQAVGFLRLNLEEEDDFVSFVIGQAFHVSLTRSQFNPKPARYLRNRLASFVELFSVREYWKRCRPASESVFELRQTRSTSAS